MIWFMPTSLQQSADEIAVVILVLQMGKSTQRETVLPQQACDCACDCRGEVHVLTPKSSHRAFKMAAWNIFQSKCEGNGCLRKTPGCASLSHMFSFFPTHIKGKYFQLTEQDLSAVKLVRIWNMSFARWLLSSSQMYYNSPFLNGTFEIKYKQGRILHTNGICSRVLQAHSWFRGASSHLV